MAANNNDATNDTNNTANNADDGPHQYFDLTIDRSRVRCDALLFAMLPPDVRQHVNETVLPGRSLEYYIGGYNATMVAYCLVEANVEGSLGASVLMSAWAYAARIVALSPPQ